MSDSKLDELTTHDLQTRCAQRAETNDLARGQRAIRANDTRQGVRHTRMAHDNACEQHARHLRTTCAKQHRGTRTVLADRHAKLINK
jgi:hypothetical protein